LLWRDSLTLAGLHPLAGFGPETFSSEFPHVQSPALSRAYPDFYHESAHNILLDAFTAQGVLGLVAVLALAALGFHAAWRARDTEPELAGVLSACLAAGLFTQQFTVFIASTALYFYLAVAMLVAIEKAPAPASRISLAIAVPVSAALAAYAILLLVADHELFRVRTYLEAGEPTAAAEQYQRVRKLGLTADIWYSRQMAALARAAPDPVSALRAWQQALEAGFRATKTAEDLHNAWYNLATLHSRQNDFARTEQCLRAAIGSSPNWFKPHWMLAQVLLAEDRRKEALEEARLATDLNGGKDPEVAAVLEQIKKQK
jgi:tetratricopeptide (TPR) repeat protein